MKLSRAQRQSTARAGERPGAFTLIELLVVIAVIAVVAALIVGVSAGAGEKRIRSRVHALLAELTVAIDGYKDEMGFYPPENRKDGPNNPPVYGLPPLYYCLKGTIQKSDTEFETLDGQQLLSARIKTEFGMDGFLNSALSRAQVKDFYRNIKPSHVNTNSQGFRYIVAPVRGIAGDFNPVHYDASSGTRHNLNSYDIWADVIIRGKTVTIGNWRE